MSIQDDISNFFINYKRAAHDVQVDLKGTAIAAYLIKVNRDKYRDYNQIEILDERVLTVYIDFIGRLPLIRKRGTNTTSLDSEAVYMHDVLPVTMYSKFEDNIELDDFIIFNIRDTNQVAFQMTFQVVNFLGEFRKHIYSKIHSLAVRNESFVNELQSRINTYLSDNAL